jgi:hypothetical protein
VIDATGSDPQSKNRQAPLNAALKAIRQAAGRLFRPSGRFMTYGTCYDGRAATKEVSAPSNGETAASGSFAPTTLLSRNCLKF